MFNEATARAFATANLGMPYRDADCLELVRRAFAVNGVVLPPRYYEAVKHFRTLRRDETPRAWDVVVIRNHAVLPNHCGLMLDDRWFVHTLETTGVVVQSLDTAPWNQPERVSGFLRYRR
jgi:cell wall-associated NlpC family hydrolase